MEYIYILKEPLTGDVRYVGKTTNLKARLYNHIKTANRGKTHCKSWIKSLLKQNLLPVLEVIECVSNGSKREQYWIGYYTKLGNKLCNHTIGGECGLLSQEHVQRKQLQVLNALDQISKGIPVLLAESKAGLSNGYLYKVRKGEIDFLKHIKVPYFRKMKRNNPIDKG